MQVTPTTLYIQVTQQADPCRSLFQARPGPRTYECGNDRPNQASHEPTMRAPFGAPIAAPHKAPLTKTGPKLLRTARLGVFGSLSTTSSPIARVVKMRFQERIKPCLSAPGREADSLRPSPLALCTRPVVIRLGRAFRPPGSARRGSRGPEERRRKPRRGVERQDKLAADARFSPHPLVWNACSLDRPVLVRTSSRLTVHANCTPTITIDSRTPYSSDNFMSTVSSALLAGFSVAVAAVFDAD